MKLSREVKTAILVIAGILLFIFGYNFLKNSNLLENDRVFFVKYDNVAGLATSAPVTINGLIVGKVMSIDFADRQGGLVVKFTVEKEFEFAKSSVVQIYSSGLISGNNLGIIPVNDPANRAVSGDTLPGEIQAGMIDGLMDKFGPLEKGLMSTLAKLDTVLVSVSEVMDDETKENLRAGIANLNATMASFNGASRKMNSLLADNQDKLNNTFSNLDTASKNFAQLSDSLAEVEIAQLMRNTEATIAKLNNIAENIEQGKGSVGKLLKDEKLYNNLSGASRQLELLLQDMKLNPKRYVHFSLFGKRPKQYEPPKDTIQ
ncbi:MAG: MCE family protein [Bacteroidia bacterium]|nr:MCE family protein [Bacteroidia bacterium]NNM22172.1 MCE family protein [Flavobacteriaceae bacterium]